MIESRFTFLFYSVTKSEGDITTFAIASFPCRCWTISSCYAIWIMAGDIYQSYMITNKERHTTIMGHTFRADAR